MITDTIRKQIIEAMKGLRPGVPLARRAKNEVRLSTLKMLSSALTNAEIDKMRKKLTEDEEIAVVKREAKKRKDAIEQYEKVTVSVRVREKIEREKKELEILQEYLPEEMPDEELEKIVSDSIDQSGANSIADMGKVMGMVMGKTKGRADGSRVSAIVKEKLS